MKRTNVIKLKRDGESRVLLENQKGKNAYQIEDPAVIRVVPGTVPGADVKQGDDRCNIDVLIDPTFHRRVSIVCVSQYCKAAVVRYKKWRIN